MATPYRNVVYNQTPEDKLCRNVMVYIDPALIPQLKRIKGLTIVEQLLERGHLRCFVDPRYRMRAVLAEIDRLNEPIPDAFLED